MRYNSKVLYVMDGNFSEFETLKQVLELAEEYKLELTLFEIADRIAPSARLMITSMPLDSLKDLTLRNRHRHLEALISIIGPRSFELRARTSFGNRAREIVSEATQGNHDLVIKRCEKGSTDKRVLRDCLCPVWVLSPEDYNESGQIIASNAPRIGSRKENQTARMCVQGF